MTNESSGVAATSKRRVRPSTSQRKCSICAYPVFDTIEPEGIIPRVASYHWRSCVPQKDWPAYMVRKPNRTYMAGAIAKYDPEAAWTERKYTPTVPKPAKTNFMLPDNYVSSEPWKCPCGWVLSANNSRALLSYRSHMRGNAHRDDEHRNGWIILDQTG